MSRWAHSFLENKTQLLCLVVGHCGSVFRANHPPAHFAGTSSPAPIIWDWFIEMLCRHFWGLFRSSVIIYTPSNEHSGKSSCCGRTCWCIICLHSSGKQLLLQFWQLHLAVFCFSTALSSLYLSLLSQCSAAVPAVPESFASLNCTLWLCLEETYLLPAFLSRDAPSLLKCFIRFNISNTKVITTRNNITLL